METNATKKIPDVCPECGASVVRPDVCHGMWDGRKPSGARAGGGLFKTVCSGCGARLVAYQDLYDGAGKLHPDVTVEPPLHWSHDA